jgi:transcriptional regulator with XRE-family HTH domain
MQNIEPRKLRDLRKRKNLTQAQLSEQSQVDQQTVSRIERGERQNVRANTLKKLASTLDVEVGVLTGELPMPPDPSTDLPWDRKSPITLRMRDGARNALTLTAGRYQVERADIVELAPYLFTWVAEMSLRKRAQRIESLEARLADIEGLASQFVHLSDLLTTSFPAEDIIAAEKLSISQRDLFGRVLDYAGGAISSDFDSATENPLAQFLLDLNTEFEGLAAFEGWSFNGPRYEICREEATGFVGGDEDAARAILMGTAPLHEMPASVRSAGAAARASWAKERAEAEEAQERGAYPELYDALDKLLPQTLEEPS